MIDFNKIDVMIVTSRENIRHITGFTGSAGIAILYPDKKYLLTDFRYKEQSAIEVRDAEVIIISKKYSDEIKALFEKNKTKTAGFEESDLTYGQYLEFSGVCENLIPCDSYMEDLRLVKTPGEIEYIKTASEIAQNAFEILLKKIDVGMTEREIALELDFSMRKLGAEGNSFETIAVAGKNSSLVHGTPSDYKIRKGDFLLLDFGCVYNGYCSDMTRTVAIGEISEKQKEIYSIVLEANEKALASVKPGVLTSDIDKVARDIIKKAGYGEFFGHALGHGVGLKVHEEPRLSVTSGDVLKPGMVITIEPGIYLEGEFGVRIEDLIAVTDKNYQNLCQKTTKEIIYL